MNRGLRARLGRLFAVQLAVIGAATVIGIYITQLVVEDLLTRQALDLEAVHFWTNSDVDPNTPLPDTANLRGYLVRPGGRGPTGLEHMATGFSRTDFEGRSRVVHVSENAGARLVLVFDSAQVSDLAFYFGILPLSIVLLLIYALLFVAYRWSQAALSPVIRLARRLEAVDFMQPGGVRLDLADLAQSGDAEVATMIEALASFTSRLDAAIERERVFTRDAGHELRTPVAVFKGSLDLLERDRSRPPADRDALARMRRTVAEMESLLETLLLLARVEAEPANGEVTSLNQVATEEIDALRALAEARGNRVQLTMDADRDVSAPKQILRIVVGNVLRNGVSFTREGKIDVRIHADGMTVTDTGIGMSSEELGNAFEAFYRADAARGGTPGHGLGLAIVNRIVKRYGWTIRARSRPGEGTTVDLEF